MCFERIKYRTRASHGGDVGDATEELARLTRSARFAARPRDMMCVARAIVISVWRRAHNERNIIDDDCEGFVHTYVI